MSRAPPSLVLEHAFTLPHVPSVSLLPFAIAHDGPAKIATYFSTRPRKLTAHLGLEHLRKQMRRVANALRGIEGSDEPEAGVVPLEGAFRGRLLLSTPILLPDGYTGLVFTTTTPAPAIVPVKVVEQPAKRIKLDAASSRTEAGDKGKGKVLMSAPDGRRRSPRKKPATKVVYSMDSDDDGEEGTLDAAAIKEEDVAGTDQVVTVEQSTTNIAPSPLNSDQSQPSPSASTEESSIPTSATDTPFDSQMPMDLEHDPLVRDVQALVPNVTFSSIQIWSADIEMDPEQDLFAKGLLEWFRVAEKVRSLAR